MPSAVGCIRKETKASSRGWSLLVVVDWRYGKDASGLILSYVEGMLESLADVCCKLVLCGKRSPLG